MQRQFPGPTTAVNRSSTPVPTKKTSKIKQISLSQAQQLEAATKRTKNLIKQRNYQKRAIRTTLCSLLVLVKNFSQKKLLFLIFQFENFAQTEKTLHS